MLGEKCKRPITSLWCKVVLSIIAVAYFCTICIPNTYTEPKRVICWDIKSYYSYLPSYFIDHNIEMKGWTDDLPPFEQKYWPVGVGKDTLIFKMTMGVSFFYAPFFAVAHVVAAPLGYPADGFSAPYSFALLLSGAFFAWLGLLVLSCYLRRRFSDKVTAAVIAILGLGTNLYWYATFEAPMSHSYSFFLFAVFLYLTELWYEKPLWWRTVLLGIVLGCISLVRPSNSLIVVVFLLYGLTKWRDFVERFKLYLHEWPKVVTLVVLVFLVWLPQCLYWKHITGSYFFYSYIDERFYFNDPKILQVLFGFRKGLFVYTPVLLAALAGSFLLWQRQRDVFWAIVVFLILNVYVVASWWCWWYGGSFGMRALIESFVFLSIPLAVFLKWVSEQKQLIRATLITIVVLLALRSPFHVVQYYNKVIHYEGMTRQAYFHVFWKVKPPEDYWNYIVFPDKDPAVRTDK